MSVLAQLAATVMPELEPEVQGQVTKWAAWLVEAASSRVLPKLPSELQGAAAAGLKLLSDNAEILGGTTAAGFAALVSHIAMGDEDTARLIWLGQGADFDARMAALDAASAATRANVVAKQEQWATVKDIALAFLKTVGTAGLPILLSVI